MISTNKLVMEASDRVIPKHSPYSVDPEEGPPAHASHSIDPEPNKTEYVPKDYSPPKSDNYFNLQSLQQGTAGQYFTKAFKNLKQKSEEQASILGHNVARKLEDVDPKLAVAGAAIAAGLGALALRKKLQNSK